MSDLEPQKPTEPNRESQSSTGLNENLAGLLCYVIGFITGIIFLVVEKKSKFVRFHAMQSIVLFGGLFILNFIVELIPILGILLGFLIGVLAFVLWIILMVKAYQKEMFKLPIVGNLAEDFLAKLNK